MKKVEKPEFRTRKGRFYDEINILKENKGVWFEVELEDASSFSGSLHYHFGEGTYSLRKAEEDGKYYVKVEEE